MENKYSTSYMVATFLILKLVTQIWDRVPFESAQSLFANEPTIENIETISVEQSGHKWLYEE